MPEGHKTHRIAIDHSVILGGSELRVSSPQGRFASDASRVDGRVLHRVKAAGKHLFYHFDNGLSVHVHLGRYGSFRLGEVPSPPPRGLVRMRIISDRATVDLNGPTACRVITPDEIDRVIGKLGPDPLDGGTAAQAWRRVERSKKPIGALLLDQSVIAGIGNIFRAEALFEIGMHPETPACDLSRGEFDRLWRVLLKMLRTGVKHDRIITVTAKEAGKPLDKLAKNERLRVYAQPDCPRCGEPIRVIKSASRKLYFCESCQSPPGGV